MNPRPGSHVPARILVVDDGGGRWRPDRVVTEEPMEIRLTVDGRREQLAVTMRTPGADFELAAGLVFSEGVVSGREQITAIRYCTDVATEQLYNVVTIDLAVGCRPELGHLRRQLFATSACGVCGKATLEALELRGCKPVPDGPTVDATMLLELPRRLRKAQGVFAHTGGLHAAALFTPGGEPLVVREDVGRHNAVDKVVGWALLNDRLPLSDHILMVSGRAGYEILQKAVTAGVPIVCAVSAPSSLAIRVAAQFNITMVGFLRDRRLNVYTGAERISGVLH